MNKENLGVESLSSHEKEIINTMRFLDVCIYHGLRNLKDCLREAIQENIEMTDSAFCSVFGIHKEDYVNYLYAKVEE